MGEIHELFVLALSLVWFAGAAPESLESAIQTEALRGKWLDRRVLGGLCMGLS